MHRDATNERLLEEVGLGIVPAALVEEAAEATTEVRVLLDRIFVVDRAEEALLGSLPR
jgi:hypothetical protein